MSKLQIAVLAIGVFVSAAATSDQSFLAFDPGVKEGATAPAFIALMPVEGWKSSISRGSGTAQGGRAPSEFGEMIHLVLAEGISVVPIDPGDYIIDHMDFGEDPSAGEALPFPRRLLVLAAPGTVHYLGGHSLTSEGFSKRAREDVASQLCEQHPEILGAARLELIRLQQNSVKVEHPCDEESKDDA